MLNMFAPLQNDTFLRACLRQPTSHTPVWLMRQAGRYLPEYCATRAKAGSFMGLATHVDYATEVTLQPLERYALDAAILFSDILTVPDAMGLGLSFEAGEGPRFAHPVRDEAAVASLKPLLSLIGKQVEYVGEAGSGCIAKLLNNYVALWNMAGVSQAFLAAKALDLPRLALVGIVSADSGLLIPDERAAERVVSLIVQAAGRLGRGTATGIAFVQSYRPDDPAIAAGAEFARGGSAEGWRRREVQLRKSAGGSPFLRTAKITVSGTTARSTHARATALAEKLRAAIGSAQGVRLLGPIPAWVPKRNGRWRENIVVRAPDPVPLVRSLSGRETSIDLDPETLL